MDEPPIPPPPSPLIVPLKILSTLIFNALNLPPFCKFLCTRLGLHIKIIFTYLWFIDNAKKVKIFLQKKMIDMHVGWSK